jgi:hypothetical protein
VAWLDHEWGGYWVRRLITPQPGYNLADCSALLASKQYVVAECFTIVPSQGAVVRLTDKQEDVSIVAWNDTNRYTYLARQAVISGLKSHASIGPSVDDQEIEISYADDALFQNWKSWPQSLLYGRLDGATITRDLAFAASYDTPWVGVTRLFAGGDPELDSVGRNSAKLRINSGLSRLSPQMPRLLYGIKCRNVFGDAKCGINLPALGVLGAVGVGSTRDTIVWSSSSSAYAFGKLHITNSDSVTRVRTILKADSTHLYLKYPLDFDPAAALQFTAFPGCSKLSTGANGCQTYYPGTTWQQHFAGCPFTPVAESAV